MGAYGCGVFSVLIETLVTRQVAAADETSMRTVMDTVMWTTAPTAEELLKIAPLALAAWALRGRVQWGRGHPGAGLRHGDRAGGQPHRVVGARRSAVRPWV
ncbi:hypothetical protein GCM10011583_51440 [Streptomyces camponoticapitis]|uniref:Uncharacterized protein n=1 Tax=Streptomyces camponoticapitis TaxID=1616125 RepID=A0ABQ2EIN7_9ACTN|nr:hypothetical protein [Streptomyces camponoticapitis]GGK13201.1 hypothetical protein GCM10011583_51440 [Streptomyces camponoticapitis]